MRIRRYLAAELCCLGLYAALLVLAVQAIRGVVARQAPAETPGSLDGAGERAVSTVPLPDLAVEPMGSFLGMSDDLLIARMRSQAIVRAKLNKGGSSLSFRVDLADGSRAAFKPAQTNLQTIPRKEVAAYRLSRLLGLDAVAPAIPRMVGRDELFSRLHPDSLAQLARLRAETIFNPAGKTAGVMMYWIPVIKDPGLDTPEGIARTTQWLAQGQALPKRHRALAAQLSDLAVFDFLIANPDRYSGGNLMANEDGTRILFMDNTMSFFLDPQTWEKPRQVLHRAQRFSQRLFEALDRLEVGILSPVLAQAGEGNFELLTPAEIRAVVARRDYARSYIKQLVATYGRAKVLCFP
jgi:hypothetical protein